MRLTIHQNRRLAFTLIELLIVLAIIVVLVSLAGVSYFFAAGRQYEKNTRATIEYVSGVLKKQWDHVIAEAKKESIDDNVRKLASPDPTGERAKVLWIKLRLAEAFPASFAEIQNPSAYIPANRRKYMPSYRSKWQAAGSPTGGNLQVDSSACLFLALSTAKGGHALNPDQLPIKAQDSNNDGLLEFCDAWGQRIAFFRFPYNNARLTSVAPPGPLDPLDQLNKLQQTVVQWPDRTNAEDALRCEFGVGYTTPVIVSAGADNLMGLEFKNATRGFPDMAILPLLAGGDLDNNNVFDAKDNLYSFDIVAP